MTIYWIIAAIIGYVLGSIPFGLLITRQAGLGDIRAIGSGNIGATNVLRTGRRELAAATLMLDASKGAAAVLLARYFLGGETVALIAGVAAFLGHCYPVWLKFKGGKGVATYIGVLLAWAWLVGLIFCAVWLVIAFARRLSSLAALTAAATAPIFAYIFGGLDMAVAAALLSLLLIFNHRANMQRLWTGTEPKIGNRGKSA
ncbi:MAG: PlsY [Devosia sp.]|nr:PlsY [Devosia sp.]